MRKNCSSDREKLLKFEAEGREFSKILNIRTVGQNNFGNKIPFLLLSPYQVNQENFVKYWKYILLYFTTLEHTVIPLGLKAILG